MNEAEVVRNRRNKKDLFQAALNGVCLFRRVERKQDAVAVDVTGELARTLRTFDSRFVTEYCIKRCSRSTFKLYTHLSLGDNNPSVYVCKSGHLETKVLVEAETKILWKDCLKKVDDLSALNGDLVNQFLYISLKKALNLYLESRLYKTHMCHLGVNRVQLTTDNVVHLVVGSSDDSKVRTFKINWIPSLKPPVSALHYMKDWYGENIPHLVAEKRLLTGRSRSSWQNSYHVQEQACLCSFPANVMLDAFYTVLMLLKTDPVLKRISRDVVTHVYLEVMRHMSSWISMNYSEGGSRQVADKDTYGIVDCMLATLLQKYEALYVPNYLNAEINILKNESSSVCHMRQVLDRLRTIIRGNCESCSTLKRELTSG